MQSLPLLNLTKGTKLIISSLRSDRSGRRHFHLLFCRKRKKGKQDLKVERHEDFRKSIFHLCDLRGPSRKSRGNGTAMANPVPLLFVCAQRCSVFPSQPSGCFHWRPSVQSVISSRQCGVAGPCPALLGLSRAAAIDGSLLRVWKLAFRTSVATQVVHHFPEQFTSYEMLRCCRSLPAGCQGRSMLKRSL